MKRILLTTLLIITFLLGGTAKADNWSVTVKITSIEVSNVNSAGVWLNFTFPPYSNHSCAARNGQYMLGGGDANINQMTLIATQAMLHSRNVTVFWGGGCSGGGYPVLLGVTLK